MTNEPSPDARGSDKVLTRLMALHPKVIDLSLDRLWRLLDRLGNPEKKLPPVIHIAGTNGKGSTGATIRAIAEAAGYRVHVYTSPHLVRFHERIRLAGTLISEDDLLSILEECEKANGEEPITYFEITTAAALLAFSRVDADLCILEVGLGGRLDATNVIDNPAATVITPVSLDHQQFLGDTLEEIAGEKAGILKKDVPAIVAPQMHQALKTMEACAGDVGAKANYFEKHWFAEKTSDTTFRYEDMKGSLSLPMPTLPGHHQMLNAALAIATLRAQTAVPISDAAIKAGLGWVRWPARLQSLSDTKLHKMLPEGSSLWLDGGHNPAAGQIIRAFLQQFDAVEQPATLILGMMGTKDAAGFLTPLAPMLEKVIAVPIPGEDGAANPAELAAAATDAGVNGVIAKDIPAALDMIAKAASPDKPPVVMIGGSLYLAGVALELADIFPE